MATTTPAGVTHHGHERRAGVLFEEAERGRVVVRETERILGFGAVRLDELRERVDDAERERVALPPLAFAEAPCCVLLGVMTSEIFRV